MTRITLLDGGMGQELTHRAPEAPTPLWGTQVMIDHPGMVQAIHADYFDAGATIATLNSYAIHRDRLTGTGLEDRFADLHVMAQAEARDARDAHGSGRIAGSIGPLRASYRPDIHPPHDEAVPAYAEVARLMTGCDLVLCETIASVAHAASVLEGARAAGLPVWLSITVDDRDGTRLRSGEPVSDVLEVAARADTLLANCSAPEAIHATLPVLADAGVPFGAYANGFEKITAEFLEDKPTVDALTSRDLSPAAYAEHAMRWVEAGATIVGGCCEVGPAHIAELARRLRKAGHEIV